VYAMVIGNTRIQEIEKTVLLAELQGYKDVANSNVANTLLEYYRSNYAIKIKEGATILYRLLYNLSPKELKVLCEYIITAKRLG